MKKIFFSFKCTYKFLMVFSISFISVFILSFHSISANSSLPSPFVGWNFNVNGISFDSGTISSSSALLFDGNLYCDTVSNGACLIYDSNYSGGYDTRLKLEWQIPNHVFNIESTDYLCVETEFILDNYYVGYVTFKLNNDSHTVYVNGNSFKYSYFNQSTQMPTISITSYQLNLNSLKTWDYPIESFNIVSFNLQNNSQRLNGNFIHGNYTFPIFDFKTNDNFYFGWLDKNSYYYLVITALRVGGDTQIQNVFQNFNNLFEIVEVNNISGFYNFANDTGFTIKYYKLKFIGNTGDTYIKIARDNTIMPIYFNSTSYKFLSNDFALNFNLTNNYLESIYTIRDSLNSQSSESSLADSKNSELNESMNQMESIESGFNDSMNSALTNIDTNFNISTVSNKLSASANFIKNEYDRFTSGTPFGTVVVFGLTLGLALLLIGKVI